VQIHLFVMTLVIMVAFSVMMGILKTGAWSPGHAAGSFIFESGAGLVIGAAFGFILTLITHISFDWHAGQLPVCFGILEAGAAHLRRADGDPLHRGLSFVFSRTDKSPALSESVDVAHLVERIARGTLPWAGHDASG